MKEWRIDLVNARIPKGVDLHKRKQYSNALTKAVLRSIKMSDPEAWADLKRLIAEAEKD